MGSCYYEAVESIMSPVRNNLVCHIGVPRLCDELRWVGVVLWCFAFLVVLIINCLCCWYKQHHKMTQPLHHSVHFYTTFWSLELYDLEVPVSTYENQIKGYEAQLASIEHNKEFVSWGRRVMYQ